MTVKEKIPTILPHSEKREVTAKNNAWRNQDISQLSPISENLVPGSEKLFLFLGGWLAR
jgi:hypothetical protein